jgi:hypothetical protein
MKKAIAVAAMVSAPLAVALLSVKLPAVVLTVLLISIPLFGGAIGLLGIVLFFLLARQEIFECLNVEVTGQCLVLL